MYHRRDFHDFGVEEPKRIRVGHHDRGNISSVRLKQYLQMIHVDAACFCIGLDLYGFVVGKRSAGGISTMRVVRNEHEVAMSLPLTLMVGFDEHEAGEFAMRAR